MLVRRRAGADARPQPGTERHDDADAAEPRRQALQERRGRATAPRRPSGPDAVAAALEPGLAGAGPLALGPLHPQPDEHGF